MDNFAQLYKSPQFKINYVPLDSRQRISRYGYHTNNAVRYEDFTEEEVRAIIRSGDLAAMRELSRFYYRTNGVYHNNIDFFASLPLYYTLVTPLFEQGKGSKAQIIKAFYNACNFVEALDVRNTFRDITREWLKTGIYYGILQELNGKVVMQDLPLEFCRTRYKDFNNLNVLEFNLRYFETKYDTDEMREAEIKHFPLVIQNAWKRWKANKKQDPWVMVPSSSGGVTFTITADQTPLLLASIPEILKQKNAVGREEKRDDNEMYKLLIQRMPIDNDGHLVFELDEVEQIHAGVAQMLSDVDTVDVLTTFGDTTLENLQENSAATQSSERLEKYNNNAWMALGNSQLLFNANNSSSLLYVIRKNEALMNTYLEKYNTWVRYLINSRFSRTGLRFDFEILPLTVFNLKEYQQQWLSGAQYGYSKFQAGIALGIKQRNLISSIDFENEFLNLDEKMKPLLSSYTQSGDENSSKKNNSGEKNSSGSVQVKNINNKGGRPALSVEERSEKTTANIESMQ